LVRWTKGNGLFFGSFAGACVRLCPRSIVTAVFCVLMLVADLAMAHLPELFGRKYVLLPSSPPVAPEPDPCGGEERPELREQAQELESQLKIQEAAQGAYNPGLADPLGELGNLYATMCNHPAAMDQYRKAIQRLRVTDGLLTRAQLPYLRALATSYEAIGDYESAQRALRQGLRVHGMGLGELDSVALRDSMAYFERARQLFISPRTEKDVELFFEALQDNRAMVEAQFERNTADYATLEAVGFSQLSNYYLLLGTDLSLASSQDAGNATWIYMRRSQDFTYSKGVGILQFLIAKAADQPDAVRARLYFRLGNWHQWNGKWVRACDHYAQAWHLAGGEDGAALRRQLSVPAELPEDPRLWSSLQNPDLPAVATIAASYRVSKKGDVSRVQAEMLGNEPIPGAAGRVARLLRLSHVRPAVSEGACVASELNGRRYVLLR
jgi:tetratricopeptide (TPR) repeat protein